MAGVGVTSVRKYSICVLKFKKSVNLTFFQDYVFLEKYGLVVFCGKDDLVSSPESSQDGLVSIAHILPRGYRIHKCEKTDSSGTEKGGNVLVTGEDGSVSAVFIPVHVTSHQDACSSKGKIEPQVLWTCTAKHLQQAASTDASPSSSLPNICFLGAEKKGISVLAGKHYCLLQESQVSESWPLSWDLPGIKEEDIVQARQKKKLVFTLHPSGNISIFSVQSRRLIAYVNHKDFIHSLFANASVLESQDMGTPCQFDVSDNLQDIVVAYSNAKYGIYRINLAEYFKHNPKHIFPPRRKTVPDRQQREGRDEDELDFTREESQVNEMGAPGNRSWWSYLDTLKNRLASEDGKTLQGLQPDAPNKVLTSVWKKWYLMADGQSPLPDRRLTIVGGREKTCNAPLTGFHRKRSDGQRLDVRGPADDKAQGKESREESCISTALRTAKLTKGLPLMGLYVNNFSALVWYGGSVQGQGSDRHGGLCIMNLKDNSVDFHSFQEPTFMSFSEDPTQPHTLLTRSQVRLFSVDINQEAIVNKMMVYKSAAVTEALCHLNDWDHCSIPIHALEIGLKHRQLDTIAFFLKGRENVFRLKGSKPEKGVSLVQPVSSTSSSSSLHDVTQLWQAMDLLTEAVATNVGESQSKQYALQLLNLALNHLNKLIHNVTSTLDQFSAAALTALSSGPVPGTGLGPSPESGSSPGLGPSPGSGPSPGPGSVRLVVVTEGFEGTRTELEEALRKLMAYTVRLRGHLKGTPQWIYSAQDQPNGGSDSGSDCFYGGDLKASQAWDTMPSQEVIQSAILLRQIPLAQAYLRRRHRHLQGKQKERPGVTTGASGLTTKAPKVTADDPKVTREGLRLNTKTPRDSTEPLGTEGLPGVIDAGLVMVYQALLKGQMERATTMLQNMGFNVSEEVRKICLYTANTGLRDFLIHELSKTSDLSEEEMEMVEFVHRLEHLYTCQSFERAKALAIEKKTRHTSKGHTPLAWVPPRDMEAQTFLEGVARRGDIFVSGEQANCENFNYGHVVLEWVRGWDKETRDRVLLEGLLPLRSKS